jgi:glucosyl-dolichyl phosphate glucuronosyltransferase
MAPSLASEWPRITACICTRNRPDYVRDCLEGLREQSVGLDRFDVVVVDSGSGPQSARRLAGLVAGLANARLVRVERGGVSLARNAGAVAAETEYVAYIDDDAIPADDWIATIERGIAEVDPRPAVLGGRILPRWEASLPEWWPEQLRGVLSIIEFEGSGEYRGPAIPASLAPYGANMVVQRAAMLAMGGFGTGIGRQGDVLLSDEDVQLAWQLQNAGHSARYDSRVVVWHRIQARRLTPAWLLSRLYWQGASTVLTRRLLGEAGAVWRELPRRLAVLLAFAPLRLLPRSSTRLLGCRWRQAYAHGFARAALGGVVARAPLPPAALAVTASAGPGAV